MPSSAGPPICARRTSRWWSTTRGFLILPWIEIPNLGSHILAIVRRRLPGGWAERYNTAPVLIEDLRPDPALHRRRLQGLGLDPRRDHPGTRALRPGQAVRQAQEGHLAPAPAERLEASPQSLRAAASTAQPNQYEADVDRRAADPGRGSVPHGEERRKRQRTGAPRASGSPFSQAGFGCGPDAPNGRIASVPYPRAGEGTS